MATGDNPTAVLFEEGERVTAAVTAAVVSGTFVRPSASMQHDPILDPANPLVGGNLIQVATCGAGLRPLGVAGYDGSAAGEVIPLITGPGMIVPMPVGSGTITAGQEVESDAAGKPITLAAGKAAGMAVNTATGANLVYIRIY